MSRYIRQTVILAKPETVYGQDAVPTGAANALLVSDMTITPLDAQNIPRELVRGHFGASEELVGTASVRCSFTVEMAGSGDAGIAPAWGNLLLGCAFAEAVLEDPDRVEYLPITDNLKSLTIYYHDAGVLHKLLGAMGTVKIGAKVGARPTLQCEFTGLDGGVTAVANPASTLSAWKTPVAMTRANVVDITLGADYAAGALSGGTVHASTGLELDFGNAVNHTPMLSSETVDITDRNVSGSMELELSAAQEVAFMASVKSNTTRSLALTIGTASGNKVILHAPAVQMINPRKVDLNGKRLIGFDLRLVPVAGNDELRLACV